MEIRETLEGNRSYIHTCKKLAQEKTIGVEAELTASPAESTPTE